MKVLVLYSTLGCHLCELAEQLLQQLDSQSFVIKTVDISDSDALVERYGIRIPVVFDPDSEQELGWPFDLEQLQQFVSKL